VSAPSDNFGFIATEDCPPVALVSTKNTFFKKNLWIADTGASCHMTCSEEGLYNCVEIKEEIKVGDGNYIKATKMGEKHVLIKQPGGVLKGYVIYNCKYGPKLWINLFSITSSLRHG
jgi:hypothetical protein